MAAATKTIVYRPVMPEKKTGKKTGKKSGKKSGIFSGGKAGAGTIIIAVIAHRFLSNLVSQWASKIPMLTSIPYAAPLAVYFLAQKGIIPISGLDTVALTVLVKTITDDLLSNPSPVPILGFLKGAVPPVDRALTATSQRVSESPRMPATTMQLIRSYEAAA